MPGNANAAWIFAPTSPLAPSTPILDTFNRPNESPIAGGWSPNPVYSGITTARVVSNQMAGSGADSHPYWAAAFAANQEAYCTIANRANFTLLELWARGTDFNSSPSAINDGYKIGIYAPNELRLSKVLNDTDTVLGTMTQAVATGDGIWIRCSGTTISAYHRVSGVWTQKFSVTDSSLTGGGNIGIVASGTVAGSVFLENFGGGNL